MDDALNSSERIPFLLQLEPGAKKGLIPSVVPPIATSSIDFLKGL
jgi:hypothetical protein